MAASDSEVKTEMEDSNPKLKLKLLVDKKNKKVLFAEANKEFVDFLFSLMSLPLGTVVKLLKEDAIVGSLGDLFGSIESLDDTYHQSSENIKSILNPKPAMIAFKNPSLLPICESANRKAYMCLNQTSFFNGYSSSSQVTVYHPYMSNAANTACPECKKSMSFQLNLVDSNPANQGADAGFVKGVVTYMVMDNLEVKPLSTISSIALINSFNIRDLSSLEEMVVDVGADQALKLLRASLESKNVLSSVFLDKKEAN